MKLNQQLIFWRVERSTVWGMPRNPAYRGTACYGKTELRPRERVTRPLGQHLAGQQAFEHLVEARCG